MKNKSFKKYLYLVFLLIILIYAAYKVSFSTFLSVQTEEVQRGRIEDTLETDGVVVRDELAVSLGGRNRENLKYNIENGERLAKNEVAAKVYASPQEAKKCCRIDDINKELETFGKLNFSFYNLSQGINSTNSKINEETRKMLTALNDHQISQADVCRNNIFYLLNSKHMMMGKNLNFEERIKNLNEEKNKLSSEISRNIDVIKSPESGYFMNYVDGYEERINLSDALNSGFKNFDAGSKDASLCEKSIGKIIKSSTWYVVSEINSLESKKISAGMNVSVCFSSLSYSEKFPFTIEKIIPNDQTDSVKIVLSCEYMNKDIAALRKEEIKIILKEYSGLKISKEAFHNKIKGDCESSAVKVEESTGVYVKRGNYLVFKKVNPIFLNAHEVICAFNSDEEADFNYLQPGDEAVLKGTELYEGKNIN